MKTGVLIVNLGTPDSPKVSDVRKYLREFLMDPRVIDIPFLSRFFLVNCVIAPFRAYSSSRAYAKLWTKEGSPLKVTGYQVQELLQQELGTDYVVSLAMRYQDPSIKMGLATLKDAYVERIVVIPLYPQYASASSGSTHEAVMREISKWEIVPETVFISKFFQHQEFIQAFCEIGKKYLERQEFDHILFSFHGLPERQIQKASRSNYCQINEACCSKYRQLNEYCYRAFETSRLLSLSLGINEEKYTVSFQSRLGDDPWIKPYTDEVLKLLAANGTKRILVFSPAFIADCLETTVEIAHEYRELFIDSGGEELTLVESLNTHPTWIRCLRSLVLETKNSKQPALV